MTFSTWNFAISSSREAGLLPCSFTRQANPNKSLILITDYPQNAIKLKESGRLVKFGYAVFDDRSAAQKLVKQGSLAIADGVAIKISPMVKN